ncbi:DUF1272 domain-containing protein [Nocardia sp. NPDC057455]|uniref:DUF1272 domain-containing protein n=1 Tax=Nocardia sp. NPDC057455 TaxID=3346138 RepID=UPI00366DD265
MRTTCEPLGIGVTRDGPARIRSYEGAFCARCDGEWNGVCPHWAGELAPRPRQGAGVVL